MFLVQKNDLSKSREEKQFFEEIYKAQDSKRAEQENLNEEIQKKNKLILSLSNEVIFLLFLRYTNLFKK